MENSIFEGGGVSVTKHMVRFGNSSYPISNIGAVSVEEKPSIKRRLAFLVAIVGLLAFAFSIPLAVIVLGLSALLAWLAKNSYKVMLRTSSGNEQAFESTDATMVAKIKAAIEQAVVERGN